MPTDRRFIADGMLGRLAQWLRVLGVDCVYLRDADDAVLRMRAATEDRILLSRDQRLIGSLPEAKRLFIPYQRYPDQLRFVFRSFPDLARAERVFTRCVVCNGTLREIPKEEATAAPPDAFHRNERFWRCEACGQLYWRGSHYDAALRRLAEILGGEMEGRTRY